MTGIRCPSLGKFRRWFDLHRSDTDGPGNLHDEAAIGELMIVSPPASCGFYLDRYSRSDHDDEDAARRPVDLPPAGPGPRTLPLHFDAYAQDNA